MELSRTAVVQRHSNLPIWPIWVRPGAKTLSNQVPLGSRLCGTHISETAGWIHTMEMLKPVVEQHQGLTTLTLDFQCQMLTKLYHRNRGVDWHGTKGM